MARIDLWRYTIIENVYVFEDAKPIIASFFQEYGCETEISGNTVKIQFPNETAYFLIEWQATGYGQTANLYGCIKLTHYDSDGSAHNLYSGAVANLRVCCLDYLETKNGVIFGVYQSSVNSEAIGDHGYSIYGYIDAKNGIIASSDANGAITADKDSVKIYNKWVTAIQNSLETIQIAPLYDEINGFMEMYVALIRPNHSNNTVFIGEVEGKNYYMMSRSNNALFTVEAGD